MSKVFRDTDCYNYDPYAPDDEAVCPNPPAWVTPVLVAVLVAVVGAVLTASWYFP